MNKGMPGLRMSLIPAKDDSGLDYRACGEQDTGNINKVEKDQVQDKTVIESKCGIQDFDLSNYMVMTLFIIRNPGRDPS